MSGKSPKLRDEKKVAKMSLKEKRAAKRATRDAGVVTKPRKPSRI